MTTTATTRAVEYTAPAPVLHLAFELGQTRWKLGFTTGLGQRPRERTIAARDLRRLAEEIGGAKERFGLAPDAPVVSCYEAGATAAKLVSLGEQIDQLGSADDGEEAD